MTLLQIERYQESLLQVCLGNLSKEDFLKRFDLSVSDARELCHDVILTAAESRDGERLEYGLILGFLFGFAEGLVKTLGECALEGWHEKHEDVIVAFGRLSKDIKGLEPILTAAALKKWPYLEYNDGYQLLRKCLRALEARGTPEARLAIISIISVEELDERKAAAQKSLGRFDSARQG